MMKRINFHTLVLAGLLLLLLLLAAALQAQSFSIDWFTIDGGGAASTGGVYTVNGTVGQPDAGIMSGGNYTLAGGFWGGVVAVQTPGAPYLTITRSNTAAIVSWLLPATGWQLDQTPTLSGSPPPWTPVPFPYATNATSISITVPSLVTNRFYRLHKP